MLTGDWLCIEGIRFRCSIGVTDRERLKKRTIVVNLRLRVDFGKIRFSDSIQDTVDYQAITRRVRDIGKESQFRLIESLASHICRTVLHEFHRVAQIRVEVWKPGALSTAKSVGAVIVSSADTLASDSM